ncbi:MAG: hypothetical protein KAT17_01880 [Candidatus Aminicenantes bacterium]|nr:hypothetical protein [Candidatus Aminicenantes bacterium]
MIRAEVPSKAFSADFLTKWFFYSEVNDSFKKHYSEYMNILGYWGSNKK